MYHRSIPLVLALSLLIVPSAFPAAFAAPVADVGSGLLNYRWSLPGASATCGWGSGLDASFFLTVAHVNDRILPTFTSDTRSVYMHAFNSDPFSHVNAECPMVLSYDGGLTVNPCQTFDGSIPSVASVVNDPYFYRESWNPQIYTKRIAFPDGGSAYYSLYVGTYADSGPFGLPPVSHLGNFDYYLYGDCTAPSGAKANWMSSQDRAGAIVYV